MAERDSKQALGMGSTTAAFVVDITGSITDMRQSLNLAVQEVRNLNQQLQITKSLMGSLQLPSMGGDSDGFTGNQVAPTPKFTPPSSAPLALNAPGGRGGGGGGRLALPGPAGSDPGDGRYDPYRVQRDFSRDQAPTFTGATNLTDYVKENPGAAALFASNIVSGALKSPADMVQAQLLMQRSAFYSGGTKTYDQVGDIVKQMAYGGMARDDMDTIRAVYAAQSLGITGPNVLQGGGKYGSVAAGVSAASNLVPGMGLEGTMRSFANMQQPRNVNMLRGLGIFLRDDNGNLKPPSQIIEDIWTKICRDYSQAYGAGRTPSKREVLIGLQPGNSLDSFLDQYFGNDPLAKQMIANGLIYKASGGGNINQMTPQEAEKAGMSTSAVTAFFGKEAESTRGTVMYAAAGAKGYEQAATLLTGVAKMMNDTMPTVIAGLTAINAYILTILGAGDNALSKLLGGIISLRGLGGKAEGGPVNDQVPYIVGEKGPELFVPDKNGVIVPNDKLPFRHHGGSVKTTGPDMTREEWANAFITKLGGIPNAISMEAVKAWMTQENGHWGNTAGYNPLNTTYNAKGSVLMDSGPGRAHGVRHYTSWEQGMDATINTLFGSQHTERGYDEIVSSIREGKDVATILRAISKSKWGTKFNKANYDAGKDPYKSYTEILNNMFSSEVMGQINTLSDQLKSLGIDTSGMNVAKSLSSLVGSGYGGAGLSSGNLTASQGNKSVVINVNGNQDTRKVVDEVLAALKKEGFLVKAGK